MAQSAAIHHKAAELGKLAVRMTTEAGSGHPSTGLALAHLASALMYRQMRWDPADPWQPSADRLVLSAGTRGSDNLRRSWGGGGPIWVPRSVKTRSKPTR